MQKWNSRFNSNSAFSRKGYGSRTPSRYCRPILPICLSATLPTILRPHHVEFNLVLQSPSDSLHPPPIYKSPYSPHPSTPFGVQAGPLGPFHPSACLCQFTHHSATTLYGIQLRTLGVESEEPVTDIIYKDSFRP